MTPAAPPLPWRAFRTPKRGNTEAEYEDAWAVNRRSSRFAVADGASEASFAALWARLLAETFVATRHPWDDFDWLSRTRRRWSAEVDELELPWYAEMKREHGAYATLLGLAVRSPTRDQPGRWRALAVGDSCLIRLRDGQRPRAFPLTRAAEFGNQPCLIGSRPGPDPIALVDRGSCRAGDRLFLMTDALAQWFLHRYEQQRRPWDDLAQLQEEPDNAFAAWVEDRREHGDLRNDDVTLVAVGPIPEIPSLPKE